MKKLALTLIFLFAITSIVQGQSTPARITLQNATTTGNGTAAAASGYTVIGLQIVENGSGDRVVNFEASVDGTNYKALTCRNITADTSITTIAASGIVTCNIGGFSKFRARVSGGTTGTVTVTALMLDNASATGSTNGGTAVTNLTDPSGTIGLTAVNGTSSNAPRSDSAPPLSQAIIPTWTGTHTFTVPVVIAASGNAQISMRDTAGAGLWSLRAVNVDWSGVSDHAWAIHFNEGLITANQPAWGENIEPRYVDGAPPLGLLEKNWDYTSIDGLTSYRPYRFLMDLNTSLATAEYHIGTFKVIGNGQSAGTDDSIAVTTANKAVSMAGKLSIGTINTSGLYPLYVTGTAGSAFTGISTSGAIADNILWYANLSNSVTGAIYGVLANAKATTGFVSTLTNTNNSSSSAHSVLQIVSTGASGGSPYEEFIISGVLGWRLGVDNSSSDRFTVSSSTDFDTGRFYILTDGTIILGNETNGTATGTTIRGPNPQGTNVAGATTTFQASLATGTGTVGTLVFKASAALAASGSTVQTSVTHLTIGNAAIVIGSAAVTPAATGVRYVCIDTAGKLSSNATACVGT